ncbi:hypothetical protein AVEN_269856-1 [Araneus ventricosus]|uniref:Reverse transcriptase domain-containing protein n=1 Tax=Araneus ventricosus TaxID=182803 RepID=A0A4Y2CFE2_ARAVE|nr:hypothetical protein AVEN_269856-1 [Araneus ventricosus]
MAHLNADFITIFNSDNFLRSYAGHSRVIRSTPFGERRSETRRQWQNLMRIRTVLSKCLDFHLADDTAIMSSGASNKIMEDLNSYLDQLGKWMIGWKIKINTDKFSHYTFHGVELLPSHKTLPQSNPLQQRHQVSGGYPRQPNDF